jgi:hypothetical protein
MEDFCRYLAAELKTVFLRAGGYCCHLLTLRELTFQITSVLHVALETTRGVSKINK